MRKASIISALIPLIFAFTLYGGGVKAQMGPGMRGWEHWGYGTGWIWHILMISFWIAVIVGIIFFIRWLVISTSAGGRPATSEDSPLEILKKRYARGEIDRQEFEEKKKDLA